MLKNHCVRKWLGENLVRLILETVPPILTTFSR